MEVLVLLSTIIASMGVLDLINVLDSLEAEVEVGVHQVEFEPNFAYGSKSIRTKLSSSDLGLDNSKNILKPTIILRNKNHRNHRFDFNYEKLNFSGLNTLTKDIHFDDSAFLVDQNISSTFDINWIRWGYKYKLLENDKSYLNLGIDLNYISVDVMLQGPHSFGFLFMSDDRFPGLVFDGNYAFNNYFGIEGKFASGADNMAKYIDTYVGLNMDNFLLKNAKLKAGYQYKRLDFAGDELDGDLRFKGVFVGFNYRF